MLLSKRNSKVTSDLFPQPPSCCTLTHNITRPGKSLGTFMTLVISWKRFGKTENTPIKIKIRKRSG